MQPQNEELYNKIRNTKENNDHIHLHWHGAYPAFGTLCAVTGEENPDGERA